MDPSSRRDDFTLKIKVDQAIVDRPGHRICYNTFRKRHSLIFSDAFRPICSWAVTSLLNIAFEA